MDYIIKNKLDWSKWAEIFQDIDTFRPMINKVFSEHKLRFNNIENVTPGTNAVFKVDSYIIKLYVPIEIVDWHSNGYKEELSHLIHASKVGFKTPKLVAYGTYKDLYNFDYIVYEYIDGEDAYKVIKNYDNNSKISFAKEIKEMLKLYNVKYEGTESNEFIKERMYSLDRWQNFSSTIQKEYINILNTIDISQKYYVHGDITEDNVLINNNHEVYVIDFADACFAPKYYEYPPLIVSLFNLDKVMIDAFLEGEDKELFCEDFFKSLILHDFGGFIIEDMYKKLGLDISSIESIYDIKDIIRKVII